MNDCCTPGAKQQRSRYDLAVIGAGSAGFSAAITAAELGAEVALIGRGVIGGTCVNIGCVPSKTLIRAAETLHNARAAARFAGVSAHAELTDWRATVRQKDELVAGLRQAKYADLLPAYDGIAYRQGPARLIKGGVEVGGARIAADKIIIATGARPASPAIPGLETVPYLTSTTALDLEELPRSLLVIGGGYIGAELAQMFGRAGARVAGGDGARHLVKGNRRNTNVVSGLARRRLGQTNARHLRVGEHDSRHRRIVVAQPIAIEGILGREFRAVRGHIHELIAARDVTGGINARAGRAHAVVDDDRAFRRERDAMLHQPEAVDVRRSSRGDQGLLRVDRHVSAVVRDLKSDAPLSPADRAVGGSRNDLYPLIGEITGQCRADLGLSLRQQTGTTDQRHPRDHQARRRGP